MDEERYLLGSSQGWNLFVMPRAIKGFSLIELMVSVAVVAILLAIAVPNFRTWMNDNRIRAAAESIQNGLRAARNEAAQRGGQVRFELKNGASSWRVCQLAASTTDCAGNASTAVIEQHDASEGSVAVAASTAAAKQAKSQLTTAITGGVPSGITFDALARPLSFNSGSIARIDVSGSTTAGRRLVVLVSAGGMVRMCDPEPTKLSQGDASSCGTN